MTHVNDEAARQLGSDEDIALITEFMMNELDPARVAEVRQRLEDDPVFRALAAPLIAAWMVKPRWQREPLADSEVEKAWQRFVGESGFSHVLTHTLTPASAKRRRQWRIAALVGIVALFLGAIGYAFRAELVDRYWDVTQFRTVPDTGGRVTLRDGTEIVLSPGSRLRVHEGVDRGDPVRIVRLEGSARFTVTSRDTASVFPTTAPNERFLVWTRGGVVAAHRAAFEVSTRGDTTDLVAFRREGPVRLNLLRPNVQGAEASSVSVEPGERGRIYRGGRAVKMPSPKPMEAPKP